MGAGGWNKGIKNSTGIAFKNKKHSDATITKLKNRPKESYKKPKAESIETNKLCEYGCGQLARFKFAKGKVCCSTSHNSCPEKRKQFSERTDHKERNSKSLATRIKKGITKSSREKALATMELNGTYDVMRKKMQMHWKNTPHQNNLKCPLIPYKNSLVNYQGTYEYNFLEKLEQTYGIEWINANVARGPALWYIDPTDNIKRLYISDFLIYNTVYEIKSAWTWNRHGTDKLLEAKNKAKLESAKLAGYNIKLILDKEEIDATTLD